MSSKEIDDNFLPRIFEKIKKMYFSDGIVDPRKKDKILNWFFEQFNIYQDNKFTLRYQLLWVTFQEILIEEKQNLCGHRILIKSNAVTIFLEAVLDYPSSSSWAPVILSSISTFLQTSAVNSTLIADVDTMLNLLFGTLKIISEIHSSSSGNQQSVNEAIYLSSTILDILENLPSSNEENNVLILCDALEDVALFIYISERDSRLENISQKLIRKINSIILNVKSKKFETLLTPVDKKAKQTEEPNFRILLFFNTIQNLLSREETHDSVAVNITCATLMKKLLHNFLIHNKNHYHSLKVIALFLAASGMDIPIALGTTSCCNSAFKDKYKNSDISILGISHVLEACTSIPQYFTSVAAPDRYLKPSMWLKGLGVALLNVKTSKNKSSWLKCFNTLLIVSPTVLDSEIVALIKTTLLNISVHSAESKKQYCELFNTLLQAHSQLHQLPKFFVKLLLALTECIKDNSGGKFLANGQILPQVQESIANCVQELPYGQMIELWKIFIETFSTLQIMSEVFEVSKGFMFFVAQLFSTFLLHVQLLQPNLPSNVHSQFSHLIALSSEEIKKNTFALKECDDKVLPLQKSVLLLSLALGEVKLAYNAYYGKAANDSEKQLSELTFDLSVLHDYFDKENATTLECYLHGDDKMLSVLVFQLMLQKVKALQFKEVFSEEVKTHMQKSVSVILEYLQRTSTAAGPWDMDLCTTNEQNYGTIVWAMFLKVYPLVLPHLSHRDFYTLCETAEDIILQNSSDAGAKHVILSTLKNEFFQESKHFQTAFVSVIWKRDNLLLCKKRSYDETESEQSATERIFSLLNAQHSKAFKYAQRTPKSNKNLGSVWEEIEEISDLLNGILSSEALPKDKLIIDKIFNVIKLFDSLPLEYLLPGNQMKCIIGLSFLFFLIPQSCKSAEAVCLAKDIASVLISILSTVRSVWLFDFVESGVYLKYILKTLEAVIEIGNEDECDWAIQLIDHLISLAEKKMESLSSIQQFISKISDKEKPSRSILIVFEALLKKLSQILNHPHKQEKYKDILASMASLTCSSFVKSVKLYFDHNPESTNQSFFIRCYMRVIDIVCCPTFNMEEHLKKEYLGLFSTIQRLAIDKIAESKESPLIDVYLLFLSKLCKYFGKSSLPQDFVSGSWDVIFSHFEKKSAGNKSSDKICVKAENDSDSSDESYQNTSEKPVRKSNISNVSVCCLCSSNHYRQPVNLDESMKLHENKMHNISIPFSLKQSEEQILRELVVITSSEKLSDIFVILLNNMGCSNASAFSLLGFQTWLSVFRCLVDSTKDKCQEPSLDKSLQKCLMYLQYIINETCPSQLCETMISIPVMDFMSFILKGSKGLPKQVLFQSLHCIVPVSLDIHDRNYELFVKLFTAAWSVVYDLFMHHTNLVLQSPAPFLAQVSKLLKSIVKAGAAESLSKCDVSLFQQVQLCAENMNRLLTVISRCKTEFAKLVPYLVADYIDTVQHITLESSIKDAILSGIHRLLDLCSEDSIQMLAVNINYICKEIYENLIKNYRQNRHMQN